jgi:Ca2+-binding RTX toxin-like protein
MRKVLSLGALMTLALLLASGVALAATINGTDRADFLVGTR